MAGPTVEDLEVGADITRVWPERWSISREGLETIIQVCRRKDTAELDRLWRKLLRAVSIDSPY